jgi:hypothetical protein
MSALMIPVAISPQVGVRPSDSAPTDVRAGLDETLSSQPVQIQPQSVLQANPFAWSAHPSIFPSESFSAACGLTRHRISMRFQYRQR